MYKKSKYYFPQLDSIRGLSFLAVYFLHAFHPNSGTGFLGRMLYYFHSKLFLGLDVFFILSSFLLTWLGINEYKINGNFSFVNYFFRRALRIWPLYFLLMLFSFVIVPYASAYFHVPVTLPPAYYYLFFISNFYLEGHVYFLKFLWTLSVEEQFYMVWGVCLFLFQKYLLTCISLFFGLSIMYTIYAINHGNNYYFHTLTYLFDFAVGILTALIFQSDNYIVTFFKRIRKLYSFIFVFSLPVILILIFCVVDFSPSYFTSWLDLLFRYVFILYTGLFIIEQLVNENSIVKLKSQRFLIYTGKISYGLYCFHGIVLTFGMIILQKTNTIIPIILQVFLFLLVNYIIAAISYRVIENPFLQFKNKIRRV